MTLQSQCRGVPFRPCARATCARDAWDGYAKCPIHRASNRRDVRRSYEKHREKRLEDKREYYEKNREKVLASRRGLRREYFRERDERRSQDPWFREAGRARGRAYYWRVTYGIVD